MQSILQFFKGVRSPRTKRGRALRRLIGHSIAFVVIVVGLVFCSERNMTATNMDAFFSSNDRLTYEASHSNIIETTIVAELASTANLPVRANAALTATSLMILRDTVLGSGAIERPVVPPGGFATHLGRSYRVLPGDDVPTVAARHSITAQTLRWANSIPISINTLTDGVDIFVPVMDGVIYTVRQNDELPRIAERYQGVTEQIVLHNNLRVEGIVRLIPGERILIPNGILPPNERPEFVAPIRQPTLSLRGNNPYAWGNCTWYSYARRRELGLDVRPHWGNAATWAVRATADGFTVNRYPTVGSIMQNVGGVGGGLGHVAVVESIDIVNNTLTISEMNARRGLTVDGRLGGFNRVSFFTFQLDAVQGPGQPYWYIH
ncbi:CHAP domain-containing protein [Candidatus Saccharibacteria bacterium]|nr:CHAP domain-containing protein [Candidatus Saccharibacteria bacterium]